MIYEDTTCIKSLNLLGPKVLGNIGASLKKQGHRVEDIVKAEMGVCAMAEFIMPLTKIAQAKPAGQHSAPFNKTKLQTVWFYLTRLLTEKAYLFRSARSGSEVLMDAYAALTWFRINPLE